MNRITAIIFVTILLSVNSFAGTDGTNELSKKNNTETKDCFEKLNRGIFAFNAAPIPTPIT